MNLVTDRTEEDVFLGTEKGRYGYKDLNRVEGAVQELLALAKGLDNSPELVVKTDWGIPGDFSKETWPTESQMARYLKNVHSLCDSLMLQMTLPFNMRNLTAEGANDIEKALEKAYERVVGILNTFKYSGELFAGEEYV